MPRVNVQVRAAQLAVAVSRVANLAAAAISLSQPPRTMRVIRMRAKVRFKVSRHRVLHP